MTDDRPRVLVLDEELPAPPNTGKRIRTLNLLTELAGDFAIDLLVHDSDAARGCRQDVEDRGIAVHLAPSTVPKKSGLLFPLRLAANLAFSRRPFSVDIHRRPGFARRLRELLAERRHALVHVEWTPYAAYLETVRVPSIIAAHNVESQIWSRMAQTESNPAKRAVMQIQAARMLHFERAVFARAPFATAVSEDDARWIRAAGCRRVEVVPNGVDLETFAVRGTAPPEPRTLAFTGSMDWRPNQDAIRWFIDAIHPLLIQRGGYRLWVVGRNPPAWMTAPGGVPAEITVTGTVDDVRGYIERALVYVVPLRIGGGSRLKILEALAMERPVVSTTVGAEGLDVDDGVHFLQRDEPTEFAAAIEALMQDPSRRLALGHAGRARAVERYGWAGIARRQTALWREAAHGGAARGTPAGAARTADARTLGSAEHDAP